MGGITGSFSVTAGAGLTGAGTPASPLSSLTVSSGQSWQNVGGSRSSGLSGAAGTIYTNNTGKAIGISLFMQLGSGSSYVDLTVNGSLLCRSSQTQGQANNWAGLTAIIPIGATYSVSTNSTSITSSNWWELF